MELVGGDIKKIPNVNWGKVVVLHKSINEYYKNIPEKYKDGAKLNTADMVLITKGSVSSLLKALPDSTMNWTDDGRISIEGTDIEFIQVSLKKGQESARIGKLSSLVNKIYGQQAMRHQQLVGEDIQQLEEGLRDFFGKAAGLIKLGASKLIDFAKFFLNLSLDGLKKRNIISSSGKDERQYLKSIEENLSNSNCPADILINNFKNQWERSIDPIYEENIF